MLALAAFRVVSGRTRGAPWTHGFVLPSPPRAPPFDVVAIAASAGGVRALTAVPGGLPANFPAAVSSSSSTSTDEVVGQSFSEFDIGLPVARLRQASFAI